MLLNADLWVSALIRRVEMAGGFAYVTRRGDAAHGSVLVKVVNLRARSAYLLREATHGDEEFSAGFRPGDAAEGGAR